jgi:hypothetical protein
VNQLVLGFLALDIARERAAEAERHFRHGRLLSQRPSRIAGLRNLAARALASLSRGSARVVRRLDSCVADDLGRSLAAAE